MVVWPHTDSASSSPSSSPRRLCPQVLHPLSSRGASNLSLRLCFAFACWFTKRGKVGVKLPQYQSGFANDDCMEWLPHFASKRRLLPPPRPIAPICFWRVRGVGAGLHVRHTQTARHTHTTVPIHQADILYSLFPPGLPSGKQQSAPGKFSVRLPFPEDAAWTSPPQPTPRPLVPCLHPRGINGKWRKKKGGRRGSVCVFVDMHDALHWSLFLFLPPPTSPSPPTIPPTSLTTSHPPSTITG